MDCATAAHKQNDTGALTRMLTHRSHSLYELPVRHRLRSTLCMCVSARACLYALLPDDDGIVFFVCAFSLVFSGTNSQWKIRVHRPSWVTELDLLTFRFGLYERH